MLEYSDECLIENVSDALEQMAMAKERFQYSSEKIDANELGELEPFLRINIDLSNFSLSQKIFHEIPSNYFETFDGCIEPIQIPVYFAKNALEQWLDDFL